MEGERFYIAGPFPQGWDVNCQDTETVKQIRPKTSRGH